MELGKRGMYVAYFWKYASNEQIEDLTFLSVDSIVDYILTIGCEFYNKYNVVKEGKKNIISRAVMGESLHTK